MDMYFQDLSKKAGRPILGLETAEDQVEVLFNSSQEGEATVMRATFAPGSITHWHTHPLGQVLYAISGVGLVQRDGGTVEEIRPGDCVWFAPSERHWHGAAAQSVFWFPRAGRRTKPVRRTTTAEPRVLHA